MLVKRLVLVGLIGVVVVAVWSTTTGVWDSAPGRTSVLRTPLECTPSPACDLSVSETRYQQDAKADPSDKYGWYNLAVIAQSDKDSTTAARDYEKAIAIDPEFESPLYNLGVIRLQAGNYTAAVSLLNRAVAANPSDVNARLELASALVHVQSAGR
jgi:Tfp pilus assembly protein PilF